MERIRGATGHLSNRHAAELIGESVHSRLQHVVLAHLSEHFTAHPDLLMAVHARFGRRNARERRGFDGGMAIAAVDAQTAHVMLMTEWNRLFANDVRRFSIRDQHNRSPTRHRLVQLRGNRTGNVAE